MKRCAVNHRVFYWEEAGFGDVESPRLHLELLPCSASERGCLTIVRPILPHALAVTDFSEPLRLLLDQLLMTFQIVRPLAWYYAPMAIGFTDRTDFETVVYDCMDELSAFRGAPREMVEREQRLLEMADVVFAGGRSLFESKRHLHDNIHLFPSSIDFAHFSKARHSLPEPHDQGAIPGPRAGYYGVIDERFDLDILAGAARLLPHVHFILLGPVFKISEHELPRAANIHYLGQKSYSELPNYLAGWDVALIPFALNEATRFVSPTKTPEYLAAARPVVSTPIADVIASYGSVVRIAATSQKFAEAVCAAIGEVDNANWTRRADAAIAGQSWDATWDAMWKLVEPGLPKAVEGNRLVHGEERGQIVQLSDRRGGVRRERAG